MGCRGPKAKPWAGVPLNLNPAPWGPRDLGLGLRAAAPSSQGGEGLRGAGLWGQGVRVAQSVWPQLREAWATT